MTNSNLLQNYDSFPIPIEFIQFQNLPTNNLLKGTVSKSNTQTPHIGLSWKEEQFWV